IIVDVVLNHMLGVNQKSGVDGRSSSANSTFDSHEDVEYFPDVPYSKNDSNDYRCTKGIEGDDYGNRNIIFGPDERPFVVFEVIDRGGEDVQYSQYTDIG
ncbi:hypothetical protein OSTOST_23044, partial [Ostertagia ostertagi]